MKYSGYLQDFSISAALVAVLLCAWLGSCTLRSGSGNNANSTTGADQPSTRMNAMDYLPEFDLQGHRGARGLLPENTIPSLLAALTYDVTTLEFDLVVTSDSILVLSHEPWFHHDISTDPQGRSISLKEAREHNIFRMTYDEVQRYDVGIRGHRNFPEQKPMPATKPSLAAAIEAVENFIKEHRMDPVLYNIETKSVPEWYGEFVPEPEIFASLLYRELDRLEILDRVFIQSFDVNTLKAMREIDEHVPLVLLVENTRGQSWNLEQLGFIPQIYSPNFRLVDEDLVADVHEKGMLLIPWTVNNPEDMEKLVKLGVDGLITDYPDRAISLESIRLKVEPNFTKIGR